ncbi:unnamed protein product [Pseudo-nitzschia multistriata]|uniref:Uncharacterized protein n=1 Tax=Pseudo-nitzschia multistriata TaxID=183589 RepID=A0A448ZE08_9STRA|nr:unnamed protein product [Pseudo-nitzschia multistriata]
MTPSASPQTEKEVRFRQADTIILVETHLNYAHSIWYSHEEYRLFNVEETREQLSTPMALRKEKRRRSLRAESIRQLVLEAQFMKFKGKKEDRIEEKIQWLAGFYKSHSAPFAIEARQRGIENDLELLNMKLREASSAILKRSNLFKKLTVSKLNNIKNTNNARWSEQKDVMKGDLEGEEKKEDKTPIAVKSTSVLRRELCKDFDLKKRLIGTPIECLKTKRLTNDHWLNEQKQLRWSAIPIQSNRQGSSMKDRPLKDIHALICRRPLGGKKRASPG